MADTANIYAANNTRYEKMAYNRVGRSGLKFPAVSLGLWHNFGSKDNYDNMKAMCRAAFDHGITQFDLANNYGPVYGSAESSLGRLMEEDFRRGGYGTESSLPHWKGFRFLTVPSDVPMNNPEHLHWQNGS